ncbi:hypothetical protein HZB01_01850 [Candidatus Woesearchaeota archaeon]|nr:hypothetical protein [Candidatus Woesearchaeota archaeon]
MRVTPKQIEDVISTVAGKDVVPLAKLLKGKQNVSEFKIAEDLKKDINETRNMLYRLYHANLVSFTRKKDRQKGWYVYYWTFRQNDISHLARMLKEERLEKLKERVVRESTNHYFSCTGGCIRLDFDQSTEFQFKCPECGNLLTHEDNAEKVEHLDREIALLEEALKV